MSKHTPGPWKVVPRHSNTNFGYEIRAERTPIAALLEANKPDALTFVINRETESNARLIASAPELLEIAKEALLNLEAANEVCGGGQPDGGDEYYLETRKMLRAVITKAEGRENE